MKCLWLILIVSVALVVPAAVLAGSGEGTFDNVVHSIETRCHVHATRIPFLGLISMVSGKATRHGVDGLHIAEFESFAEPVDGDELNRLVVGELGSGWERMIRETSKKGKEQTLIFVHPEGDRMSMFIVNLDGSEMDVVQVSVDPSHLNEKIGKYSNHGGDGDRD